MKFTGVFCLLVFAFSSPTLADDVVSNGAYFDRPTVLDPNDSHANGRMFDASLRLNHFQRLKAALEKKELNSEIFAEIAKSFFSEKLGVWESALPMNLVWARANDRARFVEEGKTITVGESYSGPPLVYVNGMSTDIFRAEVEAEDLAELYKRPVILFYHQGEDAEIDFAHFTLNRFKPFTTALAGYAEIDIPVGKNSLQARIVRNDHLVNVAQAYDSETKRLVKYLIDTKEPVSIISHSTGAAVVRNALLISNVFHYRRHRTSWVATGMPLKAEEIYPEPVLYHAITNEADKIARDLSDVVFNKQNLLLDETIKLHRLVRYLPKLTQQHIFAADYNPNLTLEKLEDTFEGPADSPRQPWIPAASIEFKGNGAVRVTGSEGHVTTGRLEAHVLKVQKADGWPALEATGPNGMVRWNEGTFWGRTNQAR